MKRILAVIFLLSFFQSVQASYILIPMGAEEQRDHLKAYGITYWVLDNEIQAWWLLNYRGGSFAFPNNKLFEKECLTRGVSYQIIVSRILLNAPSLII